MKDAANKFWDIYKEEDMIKFFEISLDGLESTMSEYGISDIFDDLKSLCKKECVYGKFWNLNKAVDDWGTDLAEVDESGELHKTLKTMVLTYWITQITLKLNRKQQYAIDYAGICQKELSEYMNFPDLIKCIRKVDEDRNILLKFLKGNWNENIEYEIDDIKWIIDYEDTKLNLRSNLEFQLQNQIYDYYYDDDLHKLGAYSDWANNLK